MIVDYPYILLMIVDYPYIFHVQLATVSEQFVGHNNDVIMSAMTFQITSLTIVFSKVYSGTDQRKHQSSALLARSPVNSPHHGMATWLILGFQQISTATQTHSEISPLAGADFWVSVFSCCVFPLRQCGDGVEAVRRLESASDPQEWVLVPFFGWWLRPPTIYDETGAAACNIHCYTVIGFW